MEKLNFLKSSQNQNKILYFLTSLLGALIVLSSAEQIVNLSHFFRYHFLFQQLPRNVILVRYGYSIALRLALIIAGLGILLHREIFRKALIFISIVTILTVYWKHPVSAFANVVESMLDRQDMPILFKQRPKLMVWILLCYNYIVTLGSSLFLIYFFTRRKVKEQFK